MALLSLVNSREEFQSTVPEYLKEQHSGGMLQSHNLSTLLSHFGAFWAIQKLESQSSTPVQWGKVRKEFQLPRGNPRQKSMHLEMLQTSPCVAGFKLLIPNEELGTIGGNPGARHCTKLCEGSCTAVT